MYHSNVDDIAKRAKKYCKKSKSEAILLAWLEYYYEKIFGSRSITDFEDCLNDGLAFIAVTVAYCPFLKREFFQDIHLNPASLEEVNFLHISLTITKLRDYKFNDECDTFQKMHNAIYLVLAWKKIRLGFIITPSEIVKPNGIQMLMLTVHLFQNLSTYIIKNKVADKILN